MKLRWACKRTTSEAKTIKPICGSTDHPAVRQFSTFAWAANVKGQRGFRSDETPVGVQTHDKRGKNHKAYLWQYGSPGGSAVFDFRMGREREGPKRFLG